MASPKVAALTRQDIIKTARNFKWHRQMPKWTTMVDGTEFPARPLVLEAAGVPPNDSTNSHQAISYNVGDVKYFFEHTNPCTPKSAPFRSN